MEKKFQIKLKNNRVLGPFDENQMEALYKQNKFDSTFMDTNTSNIGGDVDPLAQVMPDYLQKKKGGGNIYSSGNNIFYVKSSRDAAACVGTLQVLMRRAAQWRPHPWPTQTQ